MSLNYLFPDGVEKTAMAGFCGAIVYWITNKKSPRDGLLCMIVGVISAIYLGPLIEPIIAKAFETTSELPQTLSGFICGMCGISLNGLILDLVHFRTRAIREKENGNDA